MLRNVIFLLKTKCFYFIFEVFMFEKYLQNMLHKEIQHAKIEIDNHYHISGVLYGKRNKNSFKFC